MIFVKPDPKKPHIKLTHAENISPKLATDIVACTTRYTENPSKWTWTLGVMRSTLILLMPALPRILPILPKEMRTEIVKHGISAMTGELAWTYINHAIYQYYKDPLRLSQVKNAFKRIFILFKNDKNIKPPCFIQIQGISSSIFELYSVSPKFILDYKRLIEKFNSKRGGVSAHKVFKNHTYSLLVSLISDPEARNWLAKDGFDAFAIHSKLLDKTESARTTQPPNCIYNLLALYDPRRWKRKTVYLLEMETDLSTIFSISEKIFHDIELFAKIVNNNPQKKSIITTPNNFLSKIQRMLPIVLNALPENISTTIKERGFAALMENNCKYMSEIYNLKKVSHANLTPIKIIADTLFKDQKRDIKELLSYQFSFENEFSSRPTYHNFTKIREISIKLYDDLATLLANLKVDLNQKSFGMGSVVHNFVQIKAVLLMFRSELEQNFSAILQEYGIYAFNLPEHKLQKFIFAKLQNSARTGSIATKTADTYKKSVIWIFNQFDFMATEAYPITVSRTEKYGKRLNTDDYYSAEQCRELAFHIESMLDDPNITGEYRISLIFAKILLKTGWNLSPVLGIKCDDIIRTATPLNPNGVIAVILRKARAGYRSDSYTFSEPSNNLSTMRSAVADLLYIRDELTSELRASLPDSNPYKSFIFIINRKGETLRLSDSVTGVITHMLSRRNCALTFDSQKIRKGGMNHLYRQVQKDLRNYESNAKHSFTTFESSYYRIDENQSRYTLGAAIDVMGKYFTGKEISSDIVIITDNNTTLQHTPVGECASSGNDDEAKRYSIEHKRLHSEKGMSARFCADFLSCIWCKYFRLVADSEHIWKLLSYQKYLLNSMESSVLESDITEDQQVHIDILKYRITDILSKMDSITPGITKKGEELLVQFGIHPDWSFSLADAPTNQSI